MRFFSKNQTPVGDDSISPAGVPGDQKSPADTSAAEKEGSVQHPHEDAQAGVQEVEALTLSWSKTTLILVFANIWLLYMVNALQNAILGTLIAFVTSEFDGHSLINVIPVVSGALTAATFMPLAKTLDLWGRAQGFLLMIACAVLGLILMAVSKNIATFAAANTFYGIGFSGMTYCVDVITADASHLRNRGLAYAFTSSPYMITAFAGPKLGQTFKDKGQMPWAFGMFAIILPVVAAPLFFVLRSNLRKAKEQGVLVEAPKSDRTLAQNIWHYLVEFDIFGVILFSVGLTIFLLPFNIAALAPHGWSSGYIIAMIVVGFVFLFIFVAYEAFLATKPVLKFSFLSDRTVLGACALDATYQISYYCWNNYFPSFLQVVNDLSASEAGYVENTFNVVSGVLLLLVGYLIRRTGYFKWLLYIAVPLYVFTQGLMIYFRQPDQSVGYLVMCQIFISMGGSIFIIIEQLAILAAVDHQHVAAALALLNVVGTVGGSMGGTISGAIWTNTFPQALGRYLPASEQGNLTSIYEDIDVQLSYDVGSATRLAIQQAYGYSQTRMLAAGTAVMGLAFIWILLIRNINLAKTEQVLGMVF